MFRKENMKIHTYYNSAEPNRVDKSKYLISSLVLDGTLRDEGSIVRLSVRISSNYLPQINYVYIEELNRYYFVTNINIIRNKLFSLDLELDVLMSYKDSIMNLTAFVDRNEEVYNKDIIDNKIVVSQGYDVEDNYIPNTVFDTAPTFILSAFGCKTYVKG